MHVPVNMYVTENLTIILPKESDFIFIDCLKLFLFLRFYLYFIYEIFRILLIILNDGIILFLAFIEIKSVFCKLNFSIHFRRNTYYKSVSENLISMTMCSYQNFYIVK